MTTRAEPSPTELAGAIRAGDRAALARAITLIESDRADHRDRAVALLDELAADAGGAARVGITGAPGVGKSTFIEALGLHLVEHGHRVAVLAVDPTSVRTGGSILGDKTRMPQLANHPDAFIRPSPSGATVGGVARRTREVGALCEASGFDVVLVETVGVGQSDVAVAELVDLVVLLVAPGGGDDLQGIKRGLMEHADLVVVTKADGDLAATARHTAADYRHALHLLRTGQVWEPPVLTCSAPAGLGVAEVWAEVERFRAEAEQSGRLEAQRREQAVAAMWAEVRAEIVRRTRADPAVHDRIEALEAAVAAGDTSPSRAAVELLEALS